MYKTQPCFSMVRLSMDKGGKPFTQSRGTDDEHIYLISLFSKD